MNKSNEASQCAVKFYILSKHYSWFISGDKCMMTTTTCMRKNISVQYTTLDEDARISDESWLSRDGCGSFPKLHKISRFGWQPCLLDDINESSLYWQTWNHFVQICTHCFSTLSRFDEQWQRIKRIKLSTLVKTSRIISSGIKDLFLQVVCSSTLKRENRTYGRELISGAVTWIFANSFCRESISITWNGRLYSDQG